jgi:hypothetical protein
LAAGAHTVYVWALDAAGNTSAAASSAFTVVDQPDSTGTGPSTGSSGTASTPPVGASPAPPGQAPVQLGRIKWKAHGSRIELRSVPLSGLAAGSQVVVSCKGAGCPFKRRKARVSGGKAQLAGAFHHRPLRQGTRIELQITAPGSAPRTIRITIRAHRKPQIASD